MSRLFSFPDPVNDIAARTVATGVIVLVVLTLATDQRWLTLVLAYGFVARAATGPTLSPLGQLATRVIVPRLPIESRPVPGPPKRFAQVIGAVFTVTAAILAVGVDQWDASRILLLLMLVPAGLEAGLGYCIGCKAFALLMRAGIIPEEVCERCNNIWSTA